MQTTVFQRTAGGTLTDRLAGEAQTGEVRLRKPRMRSDSLPEYTRYRDDGCSISASCFSCPLPRCRYEEPGGLRAVMNQTRDRDMTQLRLSGMSVEELAGYFGVSRRTVFRVIGGVKPEGRRMYKQREAREPIPIRPTMLRKEAYCA
jgi:hypothetical protein